jgi:hypothetical protein
MRTYIIKLLFEIRVNTGRVQFDEQLRIVYAFDDAEALGKAAQLASAEADSKWKFLGVTSLQPVELTDGNELHSRIFEEEDAKALMAYAKAKHQHLQAELLLKTEALAG